MGVLHSDTASNEVIIGGVKYVPETESVSISVESLRSIVSEAVNGALGQVFSNNGLKQNEESPIICIPKGLDKLSDEKKGSELSAMLYSKLPKGMRHGARFRSFYTDFERDTGIGLYEFHKERIGEAKDADISRFPYRKADSIFMVADEKEVFEYARRYEFSFSK